MNETLYHLAAAPFEAALKVNILPPGHRARRLHGHSFTARVRAALPEDWSADPGGRAEALVQALRKAVKPLDYRDLNTEIEIPTDENLARYVRRCLDVPGLETVGIQSTRDQGADLDADEQAHLWHRFRFEAAHQLPNVPAGHPCGRMHGHGFEVILHAMQDVHGQDMGIDFDALAALWAPCQEQLHYACLNDLPGLENPTSELIAQWLWQRLKPDLPTLSWVTVYETATAGCHFDGTHYRIWKELRFESALQLRHAPNGDPRRRLHGHSYLLRLHLSAPLDEVLGWTVDYGDVKALFKPVYEQLDHHRLDTLPGLADADPGNLVHWIRAQAGERLPQLDRIDLHHTPGCGASLCWGPLGPALPS
ncbi:MULTISPECIES: 6-carboxytetrahydropterin synthase [Thiorhodovibrio]|uniref:6-carboxytetrahydropterin synthase n=1 Tax=Thiorhodovibrio TaxID=61593 RepID=UPI001911494F|nr:MULTISPECIES: 6-carboxytetrahydropterin synthase [Thiorhodovibrio]MBK5970733.1 6-pyruvoyl tetrahydropterin synthase [Thiorhodovibrio winogradskyi]WPL14579.1 6-carboxy-5,6,7,8-tetrahydropterin synthase [Thiorhodovibrio litoralis]